MDLPPLQLEMVRLGLQGQPAQDLCRPPAGSSLAASVSGSQPCPSGPARIRIDEPSGWPPLPPPPLPPRPLGSRSASPQPGATAQP